MASEHRSVLIGEQANKSQLEKVLSSETFRDWYQERQYRENIENGTPYFNESDHVPDPERHSPSKLLRCHRRLFYQDYNAPEEQPDPDGIFWVGSKFEEEIIFPFLRDAVTGQNTYVQNSIWIDYTIETSAGDLQLKGETDPVIVDADGRPILPTEIKTKRSVKDLSSPNRAHRAQLHAYLVGLSEKFDIDLTTGVILYGSRRSLDITTFHVEFDADFWRDIVLEWAVDHTEYRINQRLPPADPMTGWECDFCSYCERCGEGNRHFSEKGPAGLLTRFTGYPREKLIEYLEAHPNAKLTPSLAFEYEELASKYGVYDWECPQCFGTYAWDALGWDGDVTQPPRCPRCAEDGSVSLLHGPDPDDQIDRGDKNKIE
jgi:CRISPR/Cas system-associated exonuclease Cas4 (RecB family)